MVTVIVMLVARFIIAPATFHLAFARCFGVAVAIQTVRIRRSERPLPRSPFMWRLGCRPRHAVLSALTFLLGTQVLGYLLPLG